MRVRVRVQQNAVEVDVPEMGRACVGVAQALTSGFDQLDDVVFKPGIDEGVSQSLAPTPTAKPTLRPTTPEVDLTTQLRRLVQRGR